MRLISHAQHAMSIAIASVPISPADEFRDAFSVPVIRSPARRDRKPWGVIPPPTVPGHQRRIFQQPRSFSGRGARDLREWIAREAEAATSNEDLARRFVAECRRTRTILPGSSTIERLCADALVEAERRIEDLIAHRITPTLSENLAHLLEDTVDGRVTRFVWRTATPGAPYAMPRGEAPGWP